MAAHAKHATEDTETTQVSSLRDDLLVAPLPPRPPPDPTTAIQQDPADANGFRRLRRSMPLAWQYALRDGGGLRALVDGLSIASVRTIVQEYPDAWPRFLKLSQSSSSSASQQQLLLPSWMSSKLRHRLVSNRPSPTANDADTSTTTTKRTLESDTREISYGTHPSQVIHFITPTPPAATTDDDALSSTSTATTKSSVVAFVHGGAWGSGFPALYRLVATPFLEANLTVAIVGYRTYPTASVDGQVEDVVSAMETLRRQYCCEYDQYEHDQHEHEVVSHTNNTVSSTSSSSTLDLTLIGHSSGAHLGALALSRGQTTATRFVGIAGVYDIPDHYRYETERGVERISPLAPACGGTVAAFRARSPTRLVRSSSTAVASSSVLVFPPALLCHGVLDGTVPYTSSVRFAEALQQQQDDKKQQKVTLELIPDTEHAETALQLMFGGATKTIVLDWIAKQRQA